jgi:hypothetical protein
VEDGGTLAAFTVSVNDTVCDREPEVPVTVTVDEAAGVDGDVVIVSVDEQLGVHDPGDKAAVAPDGSPEAEIETDCAIPETVVTVMELVTDCPAVTDLLPEVDKEKSKLGSGELVFTVRTKDVEWETEPEVPVTVIVEEPAGVVADVVSDSVELQPGVHDDGENEAVVPAGIPEAENETDCAVPETVESVTVFVTDWPAVTDLFPPFVIEKSKPETGAAPEVPL